MTHDGGADVDTPLNSAAESLSNSFASASVPACLRERHACCLAYVGHRFVVRQSYGKPRWFIGLKQLNTEPLIAVYLRD